MKKVFKIILVNLVVFSLLLIIADLIVGYFSKVKPSKTEARTVLLKEHSPNLDWEEIPSEDYHLTKQNLEAKFRLRTDSNGYIIGPKRINKQVDIIFFGGSGTECMYVDEALRFPYLVSQLLVDQSGQPICTLNAGVSGNHSLHSTINLLAKGLVYKPKIVVLMHNINDLNLLINCKSYWKAPPSRAIIIEKQKSKRRLFKQILASTKDLLIPNIYAKISQVIDNISNPPNIDEWDGFRNQSFIKEEEFIDLQNQFRSSIVSFISIAKNWGIEPVLMTEFNRITSKELFDTKKIGVSYEEYAKYYSIFNETIREIAKIENCILIDLDKKIPHTSMYMVDGVHVNEAGSELVAKIISETISENSKTYKYISK